MVALEILRTRAGRIFVPEMFCGKRFSNFSGDIPKSPSHCFANKNEQDQIRNTKFKQFVYDYIKMYIIMVGRGP